MASIEVVATRGTDAVGVWAAAEGKIGLIAVIVDTCPITKSRSII